MPTVPPLPKQYSSEMVCPNGDRVVIHVHDEMERMEIYDKTGPAKIWIRRPDKGVQWSLSSDTNTYMEKVLPPASDSPSWSHLEYLGKEWKSDGTEVIAGRPCWRFVGKFTAPALRGRAGKSHAVCYVDAQAEIRRRECHYDSDGELIATIDYLVGPPPASLFELPSGYRKGGTGAKV